MYAALGRLGVQLAVPGHMRQLSEINPDLFTSLLSWTNLLDLLFLAGGENGVEGQPSWVPNWYAVERLTRIEWPFFRHVTTESTENCRLAEVRNQNSLVVRGRKLRVSH